MLKRKQQLTVLILGIFLFAGAILPITASAQLVNDLNDVIVWSYNENIYSSGTANTAAYVNPQYIKRGWFKFGCMSYNVFPDPQHSLWTIPATLNDSGALFEGGVQVSELWKTKGWPCDNPYDPDHSPPYKIPDPVFDDFATRDADDNFFWQPNPWDSITFVSIANENYQDNVLYWAYEQIDANVNALEFDVINGVGNDFAFNGAMSNKAYDSYHLGTANFAKKLSVVWDHGMFNPVNWFMPTPSASSELSLDSAKYAFDEDTTTFWQSDIAANHWIEIDFGRKRRVQQIYLILYETHILQNFSVKYWDNTLGWQDFSPSINIANNTEIHKSFLVYPVLTSKIRLFSSDSQVYLPELQIFGCGFRQFLIDKFVNDSGWSATDTRWVTQKLVDFSDINQCPDGTINTFNYQKYLVAHNWTENPFGGQLTRSNIFSPYNPLFLEWLPNAYYRGLGGVFFNDSVILDSITALYLKSYLYQDLHYFWELISNSVRNYAASQGKKIYVTYNGSANNLPLYSDYLIKGMGRGELFPAYPAPSLTDTTKLHLDGSQVQINPWRLLKKNSLAGRPNNPPVVVFLDYGFGDFPFARLGGEDEPADERAEYLKSYVWEIYAAGLRFCLPVRTSTLNALYDSTSQGLSLLDVIKHTTDFLNEHKEIYKDTTISSLESLVKVNNIVPYNGDWNIVNGMNNSPVNGSGVSIAYINAMDGTKSYLHIINHNWDDANHRMIPQSSVPVQIPVVNNCEQVSIISPDFSDSLSVSFVYEDSILSFTMAELQYYNVVILDFTPAAVENNPGMSVPRSCRLLQNHPNPFNPQTIISFQLPVCSKATLKIYDVLGKEVRTLVNENKSAGNHSVVWDGRDNSGQWVSSGIYFYKLELGNNFKQIKKCLFVK